MWNKPGMHFCSTPIQKNYYTVKMEIRSYWFWCPSGKREKRKRWFLRRSNQQLGIEREIIRFFHSHSKLGAGAQGTGAISSAGQPDSLMEEKNIFWWRLQSRERGRSEEEVFGCLPCSSRGEPSTGWGQARLWSYLRKPPHILRPFVSPASRISSTKDQKNPTSRLLPWSADSWGLDPHPYLSHLRRNLVDMKQNFSSRDQKSAFS